MQSDSVVVAIITVLGSIFTTLGAIYMNRRVNDYAADENVRLRQELAKLKEKP